MDKKTEEKIHEMQNLEQNLQQILMQKQMFQSEVFETENTLSELKSSGDEVFKLIGQVLIKSSKSKIEEEMNNKKKIIEIKLNSLEKQEASFTNKLEAIREEVIKEMNQEKE